VDVGAMGGERQGVCSGVGANVEKHGFGVQKLLAPIDETGFKKTVFCIVVDIDLRENVLDMGAEKDDLVIGGIVRGSMGGFG